MSAIVFQKLKQCVKDTTHKVTETSGRHGVSHTRSYRAVIIEGTLSTSNRWACRICGVISGQIYKDEMKCLRKQMWVRLNDSEINNRHRIVSP